MCGATLPGRFRRIIDRYAEKKDALFDAGMNYAIGQMIDLLAGGVTDLHIYTMNNARVAARMADGIRNLM
jgi:methylenetetrahydrofolate reductase (NADPH)